MRYSRRFTVGVVMSTMLGICYLQSERSQASTASPDNNAGRQTPRILQFSEPFTVRVDPQRRVLRPAEWFEVRLRVINSTQVTRSFRVCNGGWMGHWEADDERVNFPIYTMGRNFLETKTLKPGEAYEKKMWLKLGPATPGETVTFRMGFTPAQAERTYWSNNVIIEIDEPVPANPSEVQEGKEAQALMPPKQPLRRQIQPARDERPRRVRWSPDQVDPKN